MIKRVLLGLFGIFVILTVVSSVLPDQVHIERQVTIKAAPAIIFPFVNNPKNTEKWSPWLERDRSAQLTYTGPDEGMGAKLAWRSDNREVGIGNLEITESKPNELVRLALAFEGQGNATSYYKLKPTSGGTQLIWGFDTKLGWNPVMRYMGLMFEKWVGSDYERGLANLKKVVESG